MAGLDLRHLDADPQATFLGREFLLWLWFSSETGFGQVSGASGMALDLWVDDRLVISGELREAQRFDLKGGAPATSATARIAVREGRDVVAARFVLRDGELEFRFELDASLAVKGMKIPDLPHGVDPDDEVRERARLVEDLLERLDDLFEAYCDQRLGSAWETEHTARLLDWLNEDVDGG